MKIIKDKNFYKTILTIGVPIILQHLVSFSVNMADTIMLSRATETDELVSAASLANNPFFLLILTMVGLTGGGVALSSQYWGKGDVKSIRKITAMVLHIGVIISFAFGAVIMLFPEGVMKLFTGDGVIIARGVEYLRIVGISYFLCGISFTLMSMLRSVEVVKISLFTDILSLVINIFLNWVLIFGNLGFPALGIRGAAIATLAARIVGFIVFIIYVFVIDTKLRFRVKDIFSFNTALFKDLVKFGFPVLFNELMWALAITVQAAIIGHVDYAKGDAVAANAANSVIFQFFSVVIIGISSAAMVIMGKSIGEKRLDEARKKADTFFLMSLLIGVISCVLLYSTRSISLSVFDLSPDTLVLAKELMTVTAFVSFFSSVATMSIVGIFRGGGDTRFCLIIEILALWGAALPLALTLAFVVKAPVPFVFMGMKADEVIKTIICSVRVRGNKWIKELTRE